jgi:hypothetical protein
VVGCGGENPVYDKEPFVTDPAPPPPLRGKIVTSNNGDDTLSILDPDVPGPAVALPVGFIPVELEGPHHLSADPAGRFVYVNLSLAVSGSGSGPHGTHGTGNVPGYVVKLDAATGRRVGHVQVDRNPGDNLISPDGRTLYVTHFDLMAWNAGAKANDLRRGDSRLLMVDTETMSIRRSLPLCPAAHGAELSREGDTLYATCGPDQIAIVDLRSETANVRRVQIPGTVADGTCTLCPYALGVAPDDTVWVTALGANLGSNGRGGVFIYDPALDGGAFDPARRLALQGSAVFPAFVAAGASYRVIVPVQGVGGDLLLTLDPGARGTPPVEVARLPFTPDVCLAAHMLEPARDGRRAWMICEGDHRGPGTFLWLNLDPLAVTAHVSIGVFPDGLIRVP